MQNSRVLRYERYKKLGFTRENIIRESINLVKILVGTLILAIGINFFLVPNDIATGGVVGISIITNKMFGWDLSLVMLILNTFFLLMGWIFLGHRFAAGTVVGTYALPLFTSIVPVYQMTNDLLMSTIYGGLIIGLGVAIVFLGRGSTGGLSVPPMILNKYAGVSFGKASILFDTIVVLSSLLAFTPEQMLYSLFVVVLAGILVDYIETGVTRSKAVYIISNQSDEIKDAIFEKVIRGVTSWRATGEFTGQERKLLLCVVNNEQLPLLKEIVYTLDEHAFMIISSVGEVHGEGFNQRYGKLRRKNMPTEVIQVLEQQ
ncbi:MAG: YitT family protein [Culicoidibacterales bacterium]